MQEPSSPARNCSIFRPPFPSPPTFNLNSSLRFHALCTHPGLIFTGSITLSLVIERSRVVEEGVFVFLPWLGPGRGAGGGLFGLRRPRGAAGKAHYLIFIHLSQSRCDARDASAGRRVKKTRSDTTLAFWRLLLGCGRVRRVGLPSPTSAMKFLHKVHGARARTYTHTCLHVAFFSRGIAHV